jgi:tetratricopeptide (TPR) repeat protein
LTSRDFSQYGLISIAGADSTGPTAEERGQDYDTMARYLLNFFKAYLYKDEASLQYLSTEPAAHGLNPELVDMNISPAEDRPPTEEEFMQIIEKNGVDRAVEVFEKFSKSDPELTFFQEAVMNALGYQHLQSFDVDAAAKLFKMNTEAYPNSANVWDSYAEACEARGDSALVVSCLKKALEILPNDTAITDDFRQLIQTHAEQVLRDYGELE